MSSTRPPSQDAPPSTDVAVAVLMAYAPGQVLWGWWRFLFGRYRLYRWPGLRFAKVMGSGFEGGFGLKPSLNHQGLFCVFADEAAANSFLRSGWLHELDGRTREWCWLKLQAYSSRGRWSGHEVGVAHPAPPVGPVVALTRASIRLSQARAFWSMAPAAEAALAGAAGCRLAVGLGEAPVLRQATLSVWDRTADMDAYARSGAHREAIESAYRGRHFSESMFVRWRVLAQGGRWKGVSLEQADGESKA